SLSCRGWNEGSTERESASSRRRERSWRCGFWSERSGSWRVGHCGNRGSSNSIQQGRGHRRSRTICHPGSSKSKLQSLGAWLWTDRLVQNADLTWQDCKSHRDRCTDCCGRCRVLSADLLFFVDKGAGEERFSVTKNQKSG